MSTFIKAKAMLKAAAKPVADQLADVKTDYQAISSVDSTESNEKKLERFATRLVQLADQLHVSPRSALDQAIVKLATEKAEAEKAKLQKEAEDLAAAARIMDEHTKQVAAKLSVTTVPPVRLSVGTDIPTA
jgi:hypothetical protein